ncbi:hypothetical protein GCM10010123_39290 [Pilimelia anulata]|uniref:Uncharacterized protein n=1 Tax=Pilimelia anulata TaxID=53371 RepID=A0A8J3BEV0_9ACTN|nr:hypothetical protein [Pilimelia anulata]GGK05539.1 hypothetical protein GCM10010123_39290 [Pilimelia anulata]
MRSEVALSAGGNEASDLLTVRSPGLLAAHGAQRAFWTVLDEGPVEECLALLVQRTGGEWVAHHRAVDGGAESGRTEDGEALAHRAGWVYVVGSHFGSKRGPLRARRAFIARFREDDAAADGPQLHVVRNKFRLHRVLNDALRAADLDLLPPGRGVRERFIIETIRRGLAKGKSWVSRLDPGDWPLNVEAAAWTPHGTLLFGLRYPVAADGAPIVVELADVEGMFEEPARWPRAVGVYTVTGITPPGRLTGFRALVDRPGGGYDAVVGSIDALDKSSAVLDDHPDGGEVHCRHVRFALPSPAEPADADGPRPAVRCAAVPGELVADLAPLHHVEGLAESDGVRYYVTDEDHRIALLIDD